jgi:hypothetical protein
MLPCQIRKAEILLTELTEGVQIPLKTALPSGEFKNSASVAAHGEEFTDQLAYWIKKKFVAGPFVLPPIANLRVNQMLAIEQNNKVRIVMNLTFPIGASFNDAVEDDRL